MYTSPFDVEKRATEKNIVKYSSWASCALYLALLVFTIFTYRFVLPHNPKGIIYMILWFIGFATYAVQILCSSFHFFIRYSTDINLFTCAIVYVLTPFVQFFFFSYVSYIMHHGSFVVTFFPPFSPSLIIADSVAVFAWILNFVHLFCYNRIYGSAFDKEAATLAALFYPTILVFFELSGVISRYPNNAYQSALLVFKSAGYTKNNGFFHYFTLIFAAILFLCMLCASMYTLYVWKKRSDENHQSLRPVLFTDASFLDDAQNGPGLDEREISDTRRFGPGYSSADHSSLSRQNMKEKSQSFVHRIRAVSHVSERSSPLLRSSSHMWNISVIIDAIFSVGYLLLLLIMVKNNHDYQPQFLEMDWMANPPRINNSQNTTRVYGALYVIYYMLSLAEIIIYHIIGLTNLQNSIRKITQEEPGSDMQTFDSSINNSDAADNNTSTSGFQDNNGEDSLHAPSSSSSSSSSNSSSAVEEENLFVPSSSLSTAADSHDANDSNSDSDSEAESSHKSDNNSPTSDNSVTPQNDSGNTFV